MMWALPAYLEMLVGSLGDVITFWWGSLGNL